MDKSGLGILSYKMSITTLEDVFLIVSYGKEQNGKRDSLIPFVLPLNYSESSGIDLEQKLMQEEFINESNTTSNVKALLTKRLQIYKRDKTGLICEILVPVLLVLFGAAVTKLNFV